MPPKLENAPPESVSVISVPFDFTRLYFTEGPGLVDGARVELPLWGWPSRAIAVSAGKHVFSLPKQTDWQAQAKSKRLGDAEECRNVWYECYSINCPPGDCDWNELCTLASTSMTVESREAERKQPRGYESLRYGGVDKGIVRYYFENSPVLECVFSSTESGLPVLKGSSSENEYQASTGLDKPRTLFPKTEHMQLLGN